MYYIKNFLLYSFLGFVMESTLFKVALSKKHSGIFFGPFTAVYGVGIVAILLINKYFLKKLRCNKILKLTIEFIILAIILTIIEYLGGNILNILFDIDMWNYTKKEYNIGKYICLELSFIWGLLGVLYLNFIRKFTDKIISIISDKEAYFFLTVFVIDLILVLVIKL